MRYYMKSKFFKIKEDFWVKDEKGIDRFFVDMEFFSFGLQFRVVSDNKIKYKVNEKLLKFLPSYEVYDENDSLVATVKKKLTFFKDSIVVESNYGNFNIDGNIWHHNYRIDSGSRTVATVDKQYMSFTDNYYLDINYENHPFIISLVVIIDNIIDKERDN